MAVSVSASVSFNAGAVAAGHGAAVRSSAGTMIAPELATIVGIFSCAAVFIAYSLFALQPRHYRRRQTRRGGRYNSKMVISTCPLPSSTTETANTITNSKLETQHTLRPIARTVAKSMFNDRIHRRVKRNKLRFDGDTATSKLTCHVVGHHPIARNRARYNRQLLNLKSARNDKSESDNLTDKIRRRRIHLIHHHHPIARNRACYNQKRIEFHSESHCSLDDESTVGANNLSNEVVTELNSQPSFGDLNHAFDDNSFTETHAMGLSESSDDKENVDPRSERYHDIAEISSASVKSATSGPLLPVKEYCQHLDNNPSPDSVNLLLVTKESEKALSTSLNLEDACENNASDSLAANNGDTTLHASKDDLHPPSLTNSELLVPADESTTVLTSSASHQLTVLISSGVYEYIQASRQRDTLSLLDDLAIPYVVVDGMDQAQKVKRDALFQISGIRGNYPQIFVTAVSGDDTHHFLGGYDWLQSCSIEELSAIVGTTKNSEGTIVKDDNTQGNNPPDSTSTPSSSAIEATNAHLILLISNGVYDKVQESNQNFALTRFSDIDIPYSIVDGMDPLQRDKRDALFAVSGIRGNYPQIFASTKDANGVPTFLGGYDWLRAIEIDDLKSLLHTGKRNS